MATERQIEANRRNAARSSGPKSEAGKARSRANATRHGLAAESAGVEAGLSPAFEARRKAWGAEYRAEGDAASWALDRAVAASLRIERCERAVDAAIASDAERARLAWDQDRAVEAAALIGRLARDPALVARQLEATRHGVDLLIERWDALVEALETNDRWTEAEAALALDLLGVPADLRSGRTAIDAPEGDDPSTFRRELALGEVERLEELRDGSMARLDDLDRRQAMAGDSALQARPARLALRYEREAWRRYRESMEQVAGTDPISEAESRASGRSSPVEGPPGPAPGGVADRPSRRPRPASPPAPSPPRGEGWGEGPRPDRRSTGPGEPEPTGIPTAPHPRPLSPGGRGETETLRRPPLGKATVSQPKGSGEEDRPVPVDPAGKTSPPARPQRRKEESGDHLGGSAGRVAEPTRDSIEDDRRRSRELLASFWAIGLRGGRDDLVAAPGPELAACRNEPNFDGGAVSTGSGIPAGGSGRPSACR